MIVMEEVNKKKIYDFKRRFYKGTGINLLVIPLDKKAILRTRKINIVYETIMQASGVDIKEKNRSRECITYKEVFIKITRELGYRYAYIANFMNLNHSTVMHTYNKCNNHIELEDIEFLETYNEIINQLHDTRSI